jgi:predicted TIM-barrel fold metal-dependent hydrolase
LRPDHAYYFPFYAKCQELGVTAVVSMGHTLDFMPMEMGRPAFLDEVALYFPKLRIVCGHTGWPWVEEAIALVSKHPNVFLGTSAYAPRYWRPEMVRFLDSRRGRDKVLFGTDWPLVHHDEALSQIERLELRDESREKLLYTNSARIFQL